MVAFYAWMNGNEGNPGEHKTLIFDGVQTNLGNAYDKHSGLFRAPQTGYYVFTWTIMSDYHGWVYSELVVNSTPRGSILTNSQEINDEHMTTGIVVLSIQRGDDVFVRTKPKASWRGAILSSDKHRSSFSGWRIG